MITKKFRDYPDLTTEHTKIFITVKDFSVDSMFSVVNSYEIPMMWS